MGKRQYNNSERYRDYFRVFNWILELAIREEVNFILISGDIFDNRKVGPNVLTEVFYIIKNFKEKSLINLKREIPLICIEGNHDNPIYSKQSWMSFLADLGLIILLSGNYDKHTKKVIFSPYDYSSHRGGKIDINDITIYGLPYYGSFTSHLFSSIFDAIEKPNSQNSILMMHFGISGQDPDKPGVDLNSELEKLHQRVNYLALGHYHKQYTLPHQEPWIFNPGCLEITDIREVFRGDDRGVFLVSLIGNQIQLKSLICENGDTDPELIPNRSFIGISNIDISQANSFIKAIDIVLEEIKKRGIPFKNDQFALPPNNLNTPIIFFNLTGEISYSRLEVNIHQLRSKILEKFAVLEVRIFSPHLFSVFDDIKIPEEKKTIGEIEKEIFSALINEKEELKELNIEIIELMKNLKTELLVKKPNYEELKTFIEGWCYENADTFNIPKLQVELKARDKSEYVPVAEEDVTEEEELDIDLDEFIDDSEED